MGGNLSALAPTSAPPTPASPLVAAAVWLRRGHALEAAGRVAEAIAAYDHSGACAREPSVADSPPGRWARALAAMNRGNALQRRDDPAAVVAAVRSYDVAIALFASLPVAVDDVVRNACGTAWMNRGRALQLRRDPSSLAAAAASHEQAITWLDGLPRAGPPHYVRNLAGSWLNLADALLGTLQPTAAQRARVAAATALGLVREREATVSAFAELGLKARRALVDAVGRMLLGRGSDPAELDALAGEATDAIDEGLALAHRWAARGDRGLHAVAVRLFRFGAQLYRQHQPHFVVEFLLENLAAGAFDNDAECRRIADETLATALAELRRPRLLHVGDAQSERALLLARELEAAVRQRAASDVRHGSSGQPCCDAGEARSFATDHKRVPENPAFEVPEFP